MTTIEKGVYETLFNNSIFFLRKAINELVNNHDDSKSEELNIETAKTCTIFIQMSIELAIKAFLLDKKGINSILDTKYLKRTEQSIFNSFNDNTLKTKGFEQLKKMIINDHSINFFSEDDISHINQFQLFRNKIVHINLFLGKADLFDLKYELIHASVHVIIPLLNKSYFEINETAEFNSTYLPLDDFHQLIKFEPYVVEMEELAKTNSILVYNCWECNNKTFSVEDSKCYCCGVDFEDSLEYTDCIFCGSKKSVIFDHLNIGINNNIINGRCLNCSKRPMVYKCPECDSSNSFIDKSVPPRCC